MIVQFWGVRGSLTTARADVLRYGGNTSCVSVRIGDRMLVLDAGSGAHVLGDELEASIREVYFILTHLHRDHVEGFPFFAPLYEKGRQIRLLNYRRGRRNWCLLSMLDGVNYPMRPESIIADHEVIDKDELDYLQKNGFNVSRLKVNHPGGAYGYRIETNGTSLVHIPDSELKPPAPKTRYEDVVDFCKGADVLSHDAMFVDSDLPGKCGWGHSTIGQTCQLAIEAEVKHLVLFHHDPYRTDEEIDGIQEEARSLLKPHGIACTAAYEGLSFNI